MTNNHAKRRLKEAVKYVSGQWGTGWNRLGPTTREALVRAEVLAEIARLPSGVGVDPIVYHELVDELSKAAMQWSGELQ